MSQFRQLSPTYFTTPQIALSDLSVIAEADFKLVMSNRPDSEAPGQPEAAEIAKKAVEVGLKFIHIPIEGGQLNADMIDAFDMAAKEANGPVLGFCASGRRSAMLWALSSIRSGEHDVKSVMTQIENAGLDFKPFQAMLEQFANSNA